MVNQGRKDFRQFLDWSLRHWPLLIDTRFFHQRRAAALSERSLLREVHEDLRHSPIRNQSFWAGRFRHAARAGRAARSIKLPQCFKSRAEFCNKSSGCSDTANLSLSPLYRARETFPRPTLKACQDNAAQSMQAIDHRCRQILRQASRPHAAWRRREESIALQVGFSNRADAP